MKLHNDTEQGSQKSLSHAADKLASDDEEQNTGNSRPIQNSKDGASPGPANVPLPVGAKSKGVQRPEMASHASDLLFINLRLWEKEKRQ